MGRDCVFFLLLLFFFFKQKTAYEIGVRLVGSEMCIRDSVGRDFSRTSNRIVPRTSVGTIRDDE